MIWRAPWSYGYMRAVGRSRKKRTRVARGIGDSNSRTKVLKEALFFLPVTYDHKILQKDE